MTTKTRKTWACRCGHRNEPAHRKCRGCGKAKPKRRVPKHAEVLRDLDYGRAVTRSWQMHGGEFEACACCRRPRGDRNHDRDHDHRTGAFRGLLCWKCNRELLRGHTLETLRACVAYLERAENADR